MNSQFGPKGLPPIKFKQGAHNQSSNTQERKLLGTKRHRKQKIDFRTVDVRNV